MPEERHLTVPRRDAGARLDQFLAGALPDISRARLQKLIDSGRVRVDGGAVRRSHKLRGEEEISVVVPDPVPLGLVPEDIPLEIVYQDHDILVVNKPPGLVVHPTANDTEGTLVNALLYHVDDLSGISGVERPGIVHRLDKDTSGLLVVAKNDFAHSALQEQFREHTLTRRYQALIWGSLVPSEGTIDRPVGRHPVDRRKMSSRVVQGKDAVTHHRTLEVLGPISHVELTLETGRTHQIRVHLSDAGHPVVGDPVYGGRLSKRPVADPRLEALLKPIHRQMLHAFHLGIDHPRAGEYMVWEADPPEDMRDLLLALRSLYRGGAESRGLRPESILDPEGRPPSSPSYRPGPRPSGPLRPPSRGEEDRELPDVASDDLDEE